MKTLVLLLLISSPAWAWKVSELRGEALLRSPQEDRALVAGESLPAGSFIETKERSRVILSEGTSTITLGAKTRLRLRNLNPQKDEVQLVLGKIRAVIAPEQAQKTQFASPTTVAGIRGTEFFMQADSAEELICTLEGEVEVKLNSSEETISIPAGRGLKLSFGERPLLAQNSKAQVEKWTADTSLDSFPALPNFYATKSLTRPIDENLTFSWSGQVLTRLVDNLDFDDRFGDSRDTVFTQTRQEPTLSYGKKLSGTVSSVIWTHNSSEKTSVDGFPPKSADDKQGIILGQAFLELSQPTYSVKAGQQRLKWADGIHVTDSGFRPDQLSWRGVWAKGLLGNFSVEGFANISAPLEIASGLTPILYRGLRFDLPGGWASVIYVERDFPLNPDLPTTLSSQGHKTKDVSVIAHYPINRWEFRVAASHQAGTLKTSTEDKSLKEVALEGLVRVLAWQGPHIWAEYQGLYATEDHVSGEESAYNLGLANILSRTNLVQHRLKATWVIADSHSFSVENLTASAMGRGVYSAWTKRGDVIGTEWDVFYNWKMAATLNLVAGYFHFTPGNDLNTVVSRGKKDPAQGGIVRLNYSL